MLAFLRHKAGLTHTLDGRLHTRDEPTRTLAYLFDGLELVRSYLYVSWHECMMLQALSDGLFVVLLVLQGTWELR